MFLKKLKSVLISSVVSASLLASFVPSATVLAEGETGTAGANEKGVVAHWTFDNNYTESASGLTTNLGAKKLTYTEGIYGQAAVFNGKDNYLVVDPDPILNLGNGYSTNNDNFSMSAWVNLGDSVQGEKFLLDKGLDTGWNKDDGFEWSNPYRISIDGCEPSVALNNIFDDTNVDPEYATEGSGWCASKYVEGQEWFLLTVTYDGSRIKIYHDNELLSQSNYTDGIAFNNEELYIGVDHSLECYFKGAVDDLKLYNVTLSYDDVEALYQSGLKSNKELVEPTKQLVAYYPFDDDLKDASKFKNDAEKVAVGGTTKYVVGKNGKAITMSKGNYILVPAADQLNFDTEFTVSFWLKLDRQGEYPVMYRQNPSYRDGDDNDWTYNIYTDSWNDAQDTRMQMSTYAYDASDWSPLPGQSLSTDFTYEDTKIKCTNWFHYTFTYKDGQLKSFLNGELQDKTDTSDLVNISNASGDLLIGYDGDTFISGAIDELKIYNKCLSETDVEKEAKRVDSISLSKAQAKKIAAITKGKIVAIETILLYDVDANKTINLKPNDKNITYTSSNKKIFTVTSDGKLKGIKAGKAKLTITYGGLSITYNVTVK